MSLTVCSRFVKGRPHRNRGNALEQAHKGLKKNSFVLNALYFICGTVAIPVHATPKRLKPVMVYLVQVCFIYFVSHLASLP